MKEFLKDKLFIVFDGEWNLSEITATAILLVFTVILMLGIFRLVKKIIKRSNPRKDTIFSHRKNRYRNSIGKKNKY